jgi:hypothetical protein
MTTCGLTYQARHCPEVAGYRRPPVPSWSICASRPVAAGRQCQLSDTQLPIQVCRATLRTHRFRADDLGFASMTNPLGPGDVQCQRFGLAQIEAQSLVSVSCALYPIAARNIGKGCCFRRRKYFGPHNANVAFRTLKMRSSLRFEKSRIRLGFCAIRRAPPAAARCSMAPSIRFPRYQIQIPPAPWLLQSFHARCPKCRSRLSRDEASSRHHLAARVRLLSDREFYLPPGDLS